MDRTTGKTSPWQLSGRPITLRSEMAAGLALAGLVFAMLGLGTGWLPLGTAGMVVMGLALGLVGNLGKRLAVAGVIWLLAVSLAGISAMLGGDGFTAVGPPLLSLIIFALGQCLGLLAGILFRRRV